MNKRFSLVLILASVAVLTAACQVSVTIDTPPIKEAEDFFIDSNNNGIFEDDEYYATYAVYSADAPLQVSWETFVLEDVSPNELSYLVILYQLPFTQTEGDPFEEAVPIKVAHHWAEAGTTFTFDSIGFGDQACFGCPTYVLIAPEIVTQVYDEASDTYVYEYELIEDAIVQVSPEFLLETSR
ncbi:MAG: hypothetical protein GYB68_06645 [Chloroflexi bacterium]|nr:hypothetical protein [Chloroflexota bacterium]